MGPAIIYWVLHSQGCDWQKGPKRTHPLKTMTTPPDQYTPLPETYEEFLANLEPYRTHPIWDLLSPIEYYIHKDAIDKKDQNEHSNNTQEYLLDTEHSLYEIRISLFKLNRLTSCTTRVHQSRCYLLTSTSHGQMCAIACTPSADA
jgi:hypothetical protein